MTPENQDPKAAMLAEIEASCQNFLAFLDALTPEQWTGPTDAVGWTVKDHVSHLAAWAASMIAVIERRPRWEGIGVSKQVWDTVENRYDTINAVLREKHLADSIEQARADLVSAHEGLMALVEPMGIDELSRPYSDFQPWAEGASDPLYGYVRGNTGAHYDLHLEYIQKILDEE